MDLKERVKGLIGKPEAESQEVYDETYWISYVDSKFDEAKNYRSTRIERQWFINHAYYKGWHNVKYNTTSGRLV